MQINWQKKSGNRTKAKISDSYVSSFSYSKHGSVGYPVQSLTSGNSYNWWFMRFWSLRFNLKRRTTGTSIEHKLLIEVTCDFFFFLYLCTHKVSCLCREVVGIDAAFPLPHYLCNLHCCRCYSELFQSFKYPLHFFKWWRKFSGV